MPFITTVLQMSVNAKTWVTEWESPNTG